MDDTQQLEITRLLHDWRRGDETALEKLTPHIYAELKKMAAGQLRRERAGGSLQATALVHELYQKLVGNTVDWKDRTHFFAICSVHMRRILVDAARARRRQKRGGGAVPATLDDSVVLANDHLEIALAVHEALEKLAAFDERKARTVELRFFGGLSVQEAAEVLAVSENTIIRDWSLARAWLLKQLEPAGPT